MKNAHWSRFLVGSLVVAGCYGNGASATFDSPAREDAPLTPTPPAALDADSGAPPARATPQRGDDPTPSCVRGDEVFNGRDDDCDGLIDEDTRTFVPPETRCDAQTPQINAAPSALAEFMTTAFIAAPIADRAGPSSDLRYLYRRIHIEHDSVVAIRSAVAFDVMGGCDSAATAPVRHEIRCDGDRLTIYELSKGDWVLRLNGRWDTDGAVRVDIGPKPTNVPVAYHTWSDLSAGPVPCGGAVSSQDPASGAVRCGTANRWALSVVWGCQMEEVVATRDPSSPLLSGMIDAEGTVCGTAATQRFRPAARSLVLRWLIAAQDGERGSLQCSLRLARNLP